MRYKLSFKSSCSSFLLFLVFSIFFFNSIDVNLAHAQFDQGVPGLPGQQIDPSVQLKKQPPQVFAPLTPEAQCAEAKRLAKDPVNQAHVTPAWVDVANCEVNTPYCVALGGGNAARTQNVPVLSNSVDYCSRDNAVCVRVGLTWVQLNNGCEGEAACKKRTCETRPVGFQQENRPNTISTCVETQIPGCVPTTPVEPPPGEIEPPVPPTQVIPPGQEGPPTIPPTTGGSPTESPTGTPTGGAGAKSYLEGSGCSLGSSMTSTSSFFAFWTLFAVLPLLIKRSRQ